jgi:hypothetical protein
MRTSSPCNVHVAIYKQNLVKFAKLTLALLPCVYVCAYTHTQHTPFRTTHCISGFLRSHAFGEKTDLFGVFWTFLPSFPLSIPSYLLGVIWMPMVLALLLWHCSALLLFMTSASHSSPPSLQWRSPPRDLSISSVPWPQGSPSPNSGHQPLAWISLVLTRCSQLFLLKALILAQASHVPAERTCVPVKMHFCLAPLSYLWGEWCHTSERVSEARPAPGSLSKLPL